VINEVLRGHTVDRNILHKIERNKVMWIGQILIEKRLLKHVIEGQI
jgi:hypothetical protein